MKSSFSLAGALLLALVTAQAVEDSSRSGDDPPPKKISHKKPGGGFTGATPKPKGTDAFIKKKPAEENDEDAPAVKSKKAVEKSKDAVPRIKKTVAHDDDAPPPKKKAVAADDEASTPQKRPVDAPDKPEKTDEDALPSRKTASEEPAAAVAEKPARAPAAVLSPEELADFAAQPPRVQQLLSAALELTKQNLTYTYGSDDPASGGMDCSGTMAYVLRGLGFANVPRDSSSQYIWARKNGEFFAVVGKSADSFEFKELQPGDLMFWTGTYETGRDVPISHVMLYLGKEKKTGKRVMFGASDGRSYNGIQRWGVSVFDFKMPKADPANPEKSKVDFVGYARIPGLRSASTSAAAAEETVAASAPPQPEAEPKPKTSHRPAVR